jgi:aconitate hydratase
MGVMPLQFMEGESAASLGLTGQEEFSLVGMSEALVHQFKDGKVLPMRATTEDGSVKTFDVVVRLDTLTEMEYYRHGGVLQYVLRRMVAGEA